VALFDATATDEQADAIRTRARTTALRHCRRPRPDVRRSTTARSPLAISAGRPTIPPLDLVGHPLRPSALADPWAPPRTHQGLTPIFLTRFPYATTLALRLCRLLRYVRPVQPEGSGRRPPTTRRTPHRRRSVRPVRAPPRSPSGVLPHPPAPVIVTKWAPPSAISSTNAATSSRRPTNSLSGCGTEARSRN